MSLDRRTVLALAGVASFPPGGTGPHSNEAVRSHGAARVITLTDYLSPRMLADVEAGTLQVDCAPALQAALNAASGKGRSSLQTGGKLRIPAGRYLLNSPVKFTWRNDESVFDDGDMRRVAIEGDGQGNTVLFYRGDPSFPAIEIRGFKSSPGHGNGVSLRLTMSGFQLLRDLATRQCGVGLALNGTALIRMIDMEVSYFDVNIDLVDTLRVYMESVQINGGHSGLKARGGNFSNPNVYKLLNCSVSGNLLMGLQIVGGCNISLDTCTFEGNGLDAAKGASVFLQGGPAQGGAAGHIDNCYFENNLVLADVLLDWTDNVPGTIKLTACTFQRTSAARAATHHLIFRSGLAPLIAHLDSCAFKSFGDYNPSSARGAVVTIGAGVRLAWTSNLFQHSEEAPSEIN